MPKQDAPRPMVLLSELARSLLLEVHADSQLVKFGYTFISKSMVHNFSNRMRATQEQISKACGNKYV